jgi:hypothetical protein
MAEIKATFADISQAGDRGALVWTWAAVTESDTFATLDLQEYEAVAAEFSGTFGGATVILQGAVLSTLATLKDAGGSDFSKSSAGWQVFGQQVRYIKPSASGGTGQSATVTLLVRRKTSPLRS